MNAESPHVTTKDGSFGGYLALPSSGSGPGLIVVQEIFGVNQVMRDFCDFYARNGFVAFCPDLFWRIEPGIDITDQTDAEWAQAFDYFGRFDRDKGINDIAASLDYLDGQSAVKGKVGVVGYCLGGYIAYLAATRTDSQASVSYYGVSIPDVLSEADNISAPLMLHIAEQDEYVPPEQQQAIIDGLGSRPLVTIHTYPEQDHAFARPGGAHFNQQAADIANRRTIDFLTENLK